MIPVTDEMVAAARRQIPERWGLSNLRDALTAALEAAPPPPELVFDFSRMTDQDAADFAEALRLAPPGPMRIINGCTVQEPRPHPALDRPLVLGGISEIASRLEVARSTVVGWIKRADKIGMPAPLAYLAAGPVFDLAAVEAWHKAWKAGDAADAEAHP